MLVECYDGRIVNLQRFDRVVVDCVPDAGWVVAAIRVEPAEKGTTRTFSVTISKHPGEEEARRARQALAELLALGGWCILWRDLVDKCNDLAEQEARREARVIRRPASAEKALEACEKLLEWSESPAEDETVLAEAVQLAREAYELAKQEATQGV